MKHRVTVIGLGVMGQRMLTNMSKHDRFDVRVAWDPDAAACAATRERYPGIRIAADADEAIRDPETTVVYVAAPPRWHAAHAVAAADAGKAVYCEKPLAVDLEQGGALVAHVEAAGVVNIVNFSLASAAATREVERRLAAGALGEVVGVDVRIHFSQWPRAWQLAAAGWLAFRGEGGFTREVLSHWVYLAGRLLGETTLERAFVRWPEGEGAETHVLASLVAGGVPLSLAGSVGGVGPDRVECTLWGTRESCRIHDWNRLRTSTGEAWVEQLTDLADPRETGYRLQLDNAAAAVAGETHSMPDFRAALGVQAIIEGILAAGGG